MSKTNEKVLVFPVGLLKEADLEFEGFLKLNPLNENNVDKILYSDKLFFMDRDKAEQDPTHKQLIPYLVLVDNGKIFCYKRTKKGGEKRLHDLYSLGVGGHLCEDDIKGRGEPSETYETGMFRELKEEVGLVGGYAINFYGLINDNSSPVSQVHFGVCHEVMLSPGYTMKIEDPALSNGSFETIETIKKNVDMFESWSQLVIKSL